MRIGVIFCAFDMPDTVERALSPWLEARRTGLGGHEYGIAAVASRFVAFDAPVEDRSFSILKPLLLANEQVEPHVGKTVETETEARACGLGMCLKRHAEVIIQVDADEIYTTTEIERIFAFVAARPHVAWFRGSLKNYVFDEHTYLTQPFNPPRIHRVDSGQNSYADGFWDDNNVLYRGAATGQIYRDVELPCVTIPKAVAWTKHLTWLNDDRSRRKQAYQWARWQRCDFDWDDTRGGLIWRDGVTPPEIARDA